jgi:hypothetical protein
MLSLPGSSALAEACYATAGRVSWRTRSCCRLRLWSSGVAVVNQPVSWACPCSCMEQPKPVASVPCLQFEHPWSFQPWAIHAWPQPPPALVLLVSSKLTGGGGPPDPGPAKCVILAVGLCAYIWHVCTAAAFLTHTLAWMHLPNAHSKHTVCKDMWASGSLPCAWVLQLQWFL